MRNRLSLHHHECTVGIDCDEIKFVGIGWRWRSVDIVSAGRRLTWAVRQNMRSGRIKAISVSSCSPGDNKSWLATALFILTCNSCYQSLSHTWVQLDEYAGHHRRFSMEILIHFNLQIRSSHPKLYYIPCQWLPFHRSTLSLVRYWNFNKTQPLVYYDQCSFLSPEHFYAIRLMKLLLSFLLHVRLNRGL